ncbi:MAG: hypothetical protein ACLVLZ_12955 [[Clostridium] scindens]|uniref:hypothetical protein n=1 Tax=Clostridium scindens (strain JCM 10418 / VPI 12708) TaxID=29347 RepID=UPI00399A2C9E
MSRPVYYLWKSHDMTDEEFEEQKRYYKNLGYLVVGFINGRGDIHKALKGVIKNHLTDTGQ